jgi:hypothetical protein
MIKEKEVSAVNLEKWKKEEKVIAEKRKQNLLHIKDYNIITEVTIFNIEKEYCKKECFGTRKFTA